MNTKTIEMQLRWKYSDRWPYSGMVNDIWRGIQAEQNYLVALGLFAYSEALGRIVLGTIGQKTEVIKLFENSPRIMSDTLLDRVNGEPFSTFTGTALPTSFT
jgi:hypothetical protein